jgi:uncharacterized membrane protein
MWWLQTTGYHLGGLLWLIAIAVIFLIAVIALGVAGRALSRSRATTLMTRDRAMHDRDMYDTSRRPGSVRSSTGMTSTMTPVSSLPPAPELDSNQAGFGDSLKILHERYARGEISREEYLQRREDMLGRPAA